MGVWLCQCLCPKRHCIIAAGAEWGDEEGAAQDDMNARALSGLLKAHVEELVREKAINPWCGLCGARMETFQFEIGLTRFGTLEQAAPEFDRLADEQMAAAAAAGGSGTRH